MTISRCKKTIKMPDKAAVKKNVVTWTDKRGNHKTGTLTGNDRVLIELNTYQIEYRDENGKRRRESVNLKTAEAAKFYHSQKLAEVERIKAGIITRSDIAAAEKRNDTLTTLLDRFSNHQRAKGAVPDTISDTRRRINLILADMGIRAVQDIDRSKLETWIVAEKDSGKRGSCTINMHINNLKAFCNWLTDNGYFPKSPIAPVKKLNQATDRRHQRRAFTADELTRLFAAARQQPQDGKDDRELIYRLLAGTGLRSRELLLTVPAQFDFVRRTFRVDAAKTKNKKADILPVRPDLIDRLREYIDRKGISPTDRIFSCLAPRLLCWLNADMQAAGIAKKSPDGRVLDVHSLRKTFGTMLARAGVPLTTTQRLMRHSTPILTAQLYIDVDQIDMAQALDKMPPM